MLEILEESRGNVIGFKAIDTIKPDDYDELVPKFEELIRQEGTVRVLIDMSEFKSEAPSAWRDDLHFGKEFHSAAWDWLRG